MCLPPGLSVTLLRLLQIPLSLFNLGLSTLHPAVPIEEHRGYKYFHGLGCLSPFHDVPATPGVSVGLPDDCTVDQVILLRQCGSGGFVKEQEYILRLAGTLDEARDFIQAVDLPPHLQFLKRGYEYRLLPGELTVVRRKELIDHGIKFALRYPTFSTDVVVSTTFQRVMDSAYFFSQGFFGRGAENIAFLTNEDFEDPVPWLMPWKSCPRLSDVEPPQAAQVWAEKYIPPIVERLNDLIPGVGFSFDDIRGALYACTYGLAARSKSPWCNVFTPRELQDLEHELDLFLDGHSGHASKGDPRPLLGAFYIKKLIERLTDTTEHAKHLYLDFGHEHSILFPLSTMGLSKDTMPFHSNYLSARRKTRSSHRGPFPVEMVWEKFTCKETFNGPQVRLVLNGATFPLSVCQQTGTDKKYGTCSLDAFMRENEYSMDVEYKNEIWNATCEYGHPR